MKKTKKLLNPRGYLSYTQIDMFIRNRERYIRNYIKGEDMSINNSGLAYGKIVSEALENGESDDEMIGMLVNLIPKYSKSEHEIRVTFKTPYGEVDLLGKMDTFRPKPPALREYKTGRIKWTQAKANKHRQLLHYATLVYLKTKKIPIVHLDWIETAEDERGVCVTGKIQTFEVAISLPMILDYLALVSRVAKEIDEVYREEINNVF